MAIDFEYYATPPSLTRYLATWLKDHGWPIQGRCFEPCAGDGAIIEAIGRDGCEWESNDFDPRWRDLHMSLDAADPQSWGHLHPMDWCVSNVPFSLATPIIANALATARVGVAMYLRLSWHEPLKTGPRRTFLLEHPPTAILYLPRVAHQRSRKTGQWATDSVTSCWTIWIKDRANSGTMWVDTSRVDPCIVDMLIKGERMPIIPMMGDGSKAFGYIGQRGQYIDYTPPAVIQALQDEEPSHRARMDEINGLTGAEGERRAAWIERWMDQ